jgi:LPS O-antigen subunit length determinant protein (WzzB/FepE family)
MAIEESPLPQPGSTEEIRGIKQDVDLLNYVYAVFDAKWFILLIALTSGGLGVLYAKTLPETYQGVVRVDVVDISDPGGVRPDSRQIQESIGMLEYDFLKRTKKENYAQKVLAHLRSKQFTRRFLDNHNVYRYIFPEEWDNDASSWPDEFLLDKGLAHKLFVENMVQIVHAPETDIVAVRMINRDPTVAAELANLYVYEFNEYMREQALAKVANKFEYLQEALGRSGATGIQQMLFRLMEAQTAVAMLANGRSEYILEVLDPAVRPYSRHSPNRKLISILAGMAGLLLSVSLVIGLGILGKFRRSLQDYALKTGRKPVSQRRWGLRAWLLKLAKLTGRIVKRSGSKERH